MNEAQSVLRDAGRDLTAEELLVRSIALALRERGIPPLQYLETVSRDGHFYVTARIPMDLVTHWKSNRVPAESIVQSQNISANASVHFIP